MYFLAVFTASLIALFIRWYMHHRKFQSLDYFPEPKWYPIIGSALEFSSDPADIIPGLERIVKNKPIVKAWLGPIDCYLMITDPELSEFILSSPKYIKKSSMYNTMKPWMKNGILLSDGSFWQKRRKMLSPAFHFKILDGFVSIFNEQTNILIDRFQKQVGKGVFDIYPYITAYALDVICETAMGTSVKAQSTVHNEYVDAVETLCSIIVERLISSWKQIDFLFKFTNSYKVQEERLKIIHGFSRTVIQQRRKNLIDENNIKCKEITNDVNIKKKQVFLDIMLNATVDGKPLTDDEIQVEVDGIMFGGHDTVASTLSFAIYLLSKNPEAQNKMLAEIREVFGDDKNYQPTLNDLNNLKYTELVIKETLRLYPAALLISRVMEEDVNFKGTIIPKDTIAAIFIFGMHRREDLFANALKFDPERFLSNDFIKNPYSYIPFSAGSRNCLGQKFAMYEIKCALSKMVMNFEILPADSKYDPIPLAEVVIRSQNGIHVQLNHRKF